MKNMKGLGGMADCTSPAQKQKVTKKKEGRKTLGKALLKYK